MYIYIVYIYVYIVIYIKSIYTYRYIENNNAYFARLYLFVNYIFRASRALLYFTAAVLREKVDTYYIAHHNRVINRISTAGARVRYTSSNDTSPAISIDRD